MIKYVILLAIFIIMIFYYSNFKNKITTFLSSTLIGFFGFILVGLFFKDYLLFSVFSLLVSLILGIPGIFTLIIIHNLFI